jgi:hypothetical protein
MTDFDLIASIRVQTISQIYKISIIIIVRLASGAQTGTSKRFLPKLLVNGAKVHVFIFHHIVLLESPSCILCITIIISQPLTPSVWSHVIGVDFIIWCCAQNVAPFVDSTYISTIIWVLFKVIGKLF